MSRRRSRGQVIKKGKRFYPIIELGEAPTRRCAACNRRYWVDRTTPKRCLKCGSELREPTLERRQQYHGGHATKGAAEATLTKLLVKRDDGSYVAPEKQTVGEFLVDWLAAIRDTVRESTWSSYDLQVRIHIAPRIGHLLLARIDAATLNTMYADLRREGRADGRRKELSPRSIRLVHVTIHRALGTAVRWGRLSRNVAADADPPRVGRVKDMTTWSADEVAAFLESVKDDRLYPLWLLALTTGMRRGELLGLQWDDLDLERPRLAVRHSLIVIGQRRVFTEPKSEAGRRSLPLTAETALALKGWKARQAEERLKVGPGWQDRRGLVFTQPDGALIHPPSLAAMFKHRVRRCGLRSIRFHDLRHTWATLALEAGVSPRVVAALLGHADPSLVMRIYAHSNPSAEASAVERVARLWKV